MAHYVVRNIVRAAPEVITALEKAGVATVHEAAGRIGLLGCDVRARQQGSAIAGSAVTVSSHPGDNLMLDAAVEVCQPGDVLVVTTTSPSTDGMFGDLLAISLMARGVRRPVIDAGVRDIATLRGMGFSGVVARGSCPGHREGKPGIGKCASGGVRPADQPMRHHRRRRRRCPGDSGRGRAIGGRGERRPVGEARPRSGSAGRRDPRGRPVWMNTGFTFFDETGDEVQMSGLEIVETATQTSSDREAATSKP